MPTFTAYGETYIELYNEDGELIGEDSGHRPVYTIEAETIEEAMAAPVNRWEFTFESNGTHGATMFGDYDYDDVEYEETTLLEVYDVRPY